MEEMDRPRDIFDWPIAVGTAFWVAFVFSISSEGSTWELYVPEWVRVREAQLGEPVTQAILALSVPVFLFFYRYSIAKQQKAPEGSRVRRRLSGIGKDISALVEKRRKDARAQREQEEKEGKIKIPVLDDLLRD